MSVTITDDSAKFDATAKRLDALDGLSGLAGLFDQESAEKGWRHEKGEGVPRRPWLSASTDAITPKLGTESEREIGKVVDGNSTAKEALGELAETTADAAVSYVEGGKVQGKALSKAAKRRDPRKLIDSGKMIGDMETDVVASSAVPE